jgi:hypothetical protein
LPDVEADITNDDPTILFTAQKVSASKQSFASLSFINRGAR